MSLSCAVIPDFHPGDDVLQFNLRLEKTDNLTGNTCFCLQGHACDDDVERSSYTTLSNGVLCADFDIIEPRQRFYWLDKFYYFVLPPITKWDAARFLSLAVDPWMRYPQPPIVEQKTCNNVENDSTICDATTADDSLQTSEQAHAFLPLFPLMIRYTTNFFIIAIPQKFLPLTYEASIAFTAIIVNMLAFAVAAVALYDLTIFTSIRNDRVASKEETNIREGCYRDLAMTTAQLFCFNPAGVFFTTAYSESVFAMLTFVGHALAARGLSCATKSCLNLVPSTLIWALASYVRSNGSFSSIWLMLIGIGKCCSLIKNNSIKANERGSAYIRTIVMNCASILFCHSIFALVVALPVLYHDKRGYSFHCMDSNDSLFSNPEWCYLANSAVNFSLYAYVQRKHWNVGLLKYYEVKQIPNFILAMPVLILSFSAAALWIAASWDIHTGVRTSEFKGGINLLSMYRWVFRAFSASYEPVGSLSSSNSSQLILGRVCLPYYAILAGFALIGTFVAHVQISTRLICSSCPSFYWFITILVSGGLQNEKGKNNKLRLKSVAHAPGLIWLYISIYNILGIIMHVNWLPWT